jgi:hypothetical protein
MAVAPVAPLPLHDNSGDCVADFRVSFSHRERFGQSHGCGIFASADQYVLTHVVVCSWNRDFSLARGFKNKAFNEVGG